jgi:hypothetical protein
MDWYQTVRYLKIRKVRILERCGGDGRKVLFGHSDIIGTLEGTNIAYSKYTNCMTWNTPYSENRVEKQVFARITGFRKVLSFLNAYITAGLDRKVPKAHDSRSRWPGPVGARRALRESIYKIEATLQSRRDKKTSHVAFAWRLSEKKRIQTVERA